PALPDGGPMDAGAPDAPSMDAPMVDAPRMDSPMVDAPTTDAPMVDAPMVDAPVMDVPLVDMPTTDVPLVDAPPDAPFDGGGVIRAPRPVYPLSSSTAPALPTFRWERAPGTDGAELELSATRDFSTPVTV